MITKRKNQWAKWVVLAMTLTVFQVISASCGKVSVSSSSSSSGSTTALPTKVSTDVK